MVLTAMLKPPMDAEEIVTALGAVLHPRNGSWTGVIAHFSNSLAGR